MIGDVSNIEYVLKNIKGSKCVQFKKEFLFYVNMIDIRLGYINFLEMRLDVGYQGKVFDFFLLSFIINLVYVFFVIFLYQNLKIYFVIFLYLKYIINFVFYR